MARADVLDVLYAKQISPLDFKFDSLIAPPMLSFISMQDIYELNKIATSIKLSSKPKQKYKMIDDILKPKGFKKLASGTNRVVYKCLDNQNVVLKIAIDQVGLGDNPSEYMNQFKLKPFCTKVFEVSPCGTVALVERVNPITSREEYMQIAGNVFDLLVNKIIGKYVLEDIGTKYFQNIGIRNGFGPVLLDFPYVYDLDGAKLYCNKPNGDGTVCGGLIDYDSGFNKLVCEKCGKQYFAKQLAAYKNDNVITISKGDMEDMSISIKRGNEVVERFENYSSTATIKKQEKADVTIKGYDKYEERIKTKKEDSVSVSAPVQKLDTPNKNLNVYTSEVVKNVAEERCNKNISSSDFAGGIKKEVFSNHQEQEEVEKDDPSLVVSAGSFGTSLGNLMPNIDFGEESEDKEDSIEEETVEDVEVESETDADEAVEEEPVVEAEEDQEEEFDEIDEDEEDVELLVGLDLGDEQLQDGTIVTSKIDVVDNDEFNDKMSSLSEAY